jgi:predicted ThiF/HesA family dinucleotide-utilizing enzyme
MTVTAMKTPKAITEYIVYLKNLSNLSISFINIKGRQIKVPKTAAISVENQSYGSKALTTMYKLSTISR